MPDTETQSIESLARQAYECFEIAHRATGDTPTGPREDGDPYVRVRDGSPKWVNDLCREAHSVDGSLILPDDWRYDCLHSALEAIADGANEDDGAHGFADGYVDVYNSDRLAWLASDICRLSYVDEARNQGLIGLSADTIEAIGAGQYMEALEVFALVWRALEARLNDEDDDAV